MSQTYFAILTAVGEAKLANATALGTQLQISRMAVGDGNGNLPTPNRSQTALLNEQYRADLNNLQVDPLNTSQIIAELVIPETEGGYWLREMGLYDAAGDLIAVSNCPPSYKPQLAEGSGRTQVLRMVLIVSSTAAVQLKIDPSVVLATRDFVTTTVAAALARLDGKDSVKVATTANLAALSGLLTVDDVVLVAGDRVLVKDQTTASQNGIYIAAAGAWPRSADADTSAEVTPGMTVPVEQGTTLADTIWELTTNAPITLGTTALVFELTAALNATQVDAETGTNNTRRMTPLRVKQAIAALVPPSTDGHAGAVSGLKASASGTSASVLVTANSLCVKDAGNKQKVLNALSININSAATGTNGLDTGTLAPSTWYSVWVIWNGTIPSGLLSLSETAPTLPSGYTHKARVGWVRTDASANKYPLSFIQFGRRAQYRVAAGSNVPSLPVMAGGVQGNPVHIPVFVAVGVAGVVPPTAGRISLTMYGYIANTSVIVAPNASHYGVTSTAGLASPLHISQGSGTGATHASVTGEFALESSNIFYASSAPATGVACLGWEDNL